MMTTTNIPFTREYIGDQGEVAIFRLSRLPDNFCGTLGENSNGLNALGQQIISHSEEGNHHVLCYAEGGAPLVEERTDTGVPVGMQIFYSLLDAPGQLKQDAAVPHEHYDLPAGLYEFRISREFDPFLMQARQVAD